MYENSLRLAKMIEAIADDIDNNESYEFDTNAECLFMEMISDTLRQQYEMILMYVGKLKDCDAKDEQIGIALGEIQK